MESRGSEIHDGKYNECNDREKYVKIFLKIIKLRKKIESKYHTFSNNENIPFAIHLSCVHQL